MGRHSPRRATRRDDLRAVALLVWLGIVVATVQASLAAWLS